MHVKVSSVKWQPFCLGLNVLTVEMNYGTDTPVWPYPAGLDLNFQGHLSRRTSEIENSPVLHELTPVRAIITVIMFLIIDLSCQTSVIIIQPVREAIF